MVETSSIVNQLEGVIRELKGVDELPHSVDDTLVDRLIDSIQATENGLVHMIKDVFSVDDLLEYGSVSLSILLKITAKIVSAGVVGSSYSQSISTVLPSLSSLPSSSVQDAFSQCVSVDLRRWILSRLPTDQISVFVRRKAILFIKMEKDDKVIKSLIDLSIDNLDSAPSSFVLDSYCLLLAHFNLNLSDEEKEKIWKSAKKCYRLIQSFIDLLTVIGEGSFSAHLSVPFHWISSPARMKVMIAIAKKFNDRSIIASILESEEPSIDLLDSLLPSLSYEEIFNLFSSISPSTRYSASSFTSLLSQLISRFSPSSLHPIYSFYLPRVMKDASPMVKTLPSIEDWSTVLPDLYEDLLSRIESCVTSNEWETRDSSLELLQIMPTVPSSLHSTLLSSISSDPSPYIRSLSLRLISKCNPLLLLDCIEDVILKDDDHLVRLEGTRIVLKEGKVGEGEGLRWKEKMNGMAKWILMDEDRETRLEGLKMIEILMEEEEKEGKGWKWRQELLRWRVDTDIGMEVRRLLGEEEEKGEKEEDVIHTLIASLNLHSEDIDCY